MGETARFFFFPGSLLCISIPKDPFVCPKKMDFPIIPLKGWDVSTINPIFGEVFGSLGYMYK